MKKGTFTTQKHFNNSEELIAVLPFYFNENNSDISIVAFIDGLVTVTVSFGNGSGWNTIQADLARETELSYQLGAYTMGYCG